MNTASSDHLSNEIQVIGVGSPVVDFIAEVKDDVLSSINGKKGGMELIDSGAMQSLLDHIGGSPVRMPGGSAGNTTFALARMGMKCAFLGKLGNDDNGAYYEDSFRQFGGDCSRFKTDEKEPTACCLSLVTPDSERTMRTYLGAAMTLAPSDIIPEDFVGCSHVHVEGYLLFNHELLRTVLETAKNAGCSISLDLGSFEVVEAARGILPEMLDRYVDIVFANEEEAEAFCGESDPLIGLGELGKLCEITAVKIGKNGAWLKDNKEAVHVPVIPVESVIDTTGAGDYWAAGFLYGFMNGYSLTASGHLGAILGGHVVQNPGAALTADTWRRVLHEIDGVK